MTKLQLQYQEGVKIFFTSDDHLGHKNIIRFTSRLFDNVKAMDLALITNWNSVVGERDIVFILGDFVWSDSSHEINRILRKLNGHKYFIQGNHDSDKALRNLPENVTRLSDIVHLWYTDEDGSINEFCLSHYPLYAWQGMERWSINLHGHIHSGENSIMGYDTQFYSPFHYDIGVDNNGLAPIEINDLIEKLWQRKAQYPDLMKVLLARTAKMREIFTT